MSPALHKLHWLSLYIFLHVGQQKKRSFCCFCPFVRSVADWKQTGTQSLFLARPRRQWLHGSVVPGWSPPVASWWLDHAGVWWDLGQPCQDGLSSAISSKEAISSLQKEENFLQFFILKYVIIEVFPASPIGLAVCQFSEPASFWFCQAQRKLLTASCRELLHCWRFFSSLKSI